MLDLGCGTGFHLPRFAADGRARCRRRAAPRPRCALARRRTRALPNVTVLQGTAQALPLPDASVDVVHARWAYFFGPGCEPGLAELDRVVRRGGTAFVIDNDADPLDVRRLVPARATRRSTRSRSSGSGPARAGPGRRVDIGWRSTSRADLETVVRIEFTPEVADAVLAEHEGTEVDYAVNLWWRRF